MARTQQHYSPLGDNLNKLTRVIRVRLFTQIDGWLKPFPSRSQINFRWVNTSFYLIYSVVLVFFRLLNFGSIQFVVYLYVTSWTANILSSCHSLPFFLVIISYWIWSKQKAAFSLLTLTSYRWRTNHLCPLPLPTLISYPFASWYMVSGANVERSQSLLLTPLWLPVAVITFSAKQIFLAK